MFRLVMIVSLSLTMFTACGNKKADKPKVKAPTAPAMNCAQFEKRAYECTDDLVKSYAATAFAKRVRGKTTDEKATALKKALGMLKTLKGQNACENMHAWGNLKEKGPRWRQRFHKCKADAPCAAWGKCVGNALGQPLKIP